MSRAKKTIGTVVMVIVLVSLMLVTTEAVAQSRGRSIRMPSRSGSGLRLPSAIGRSGRSGLSGLSGLSRGNGSRGNLFSGSSRSGFPVLEGLGALLDEAGRNYGQGGYHGGYGPWNHHWDHHDYYSDAEAYRDVGIANAVVDLLGILVNASAYQTYAPVAAAPVEVVPAPVEPVPVPSAAPVTVVPGPTVIVQTPVYRTPPPVYLTPPSPVPMPYPGSYSGYHGGHRYYKTPTLSRNGPGMTPQRTAIRQTSPMVGRSRVSAHSSGMRPTRSSMRRAPVQTSSWSYRVR
jgi:hypothetical protein